MVPSRFALTLLVVNALLVGASANPARADAIVRSQAMLASTIAEYRIEEGRVLLELEISESDLPAFANLLPDELYEALGNDPKPYPDRIARFFAHDLAISASGEPLPGRILEIGPRPRVQRDDLTGEPLDPEPGSEPEIAVFARLAYATPGRPERLVLFGPHAEAPVSLGFVAYHEGVAVNDFRYLSPEQVLLLDWDDPWYSHFVRRILRRQYFAPMSGFVYVEPFEVRKEIVARPLDLQRFVDLGLTDRDVLPASERARVTRAIGEFLRVRHPVRIDGQEIAPELARVNFLERTLRTSRVVEPGLDIDLRSAIVGTIFVYPTDGLPREVTMTWDLWDERIEVVPASSVDQAGPLPEFLTPDRAVLTWTNFLKNPQMPTLAVVAEPPGVVARSMRVVRWGFVALLVGFALGVFRARGLGRSPRLAPLGVAALATAAVFVVAQRSELSTEEAREIVSALLTNVYRAFDHRGEERIYDALAASTSGAVLEQAYLETRRGLELQNQGGARAKVEAVEVQDLALAAGDGEGFEARAVWNVAGSIGHWGHVHRRNNQYEAVLEIAPVEGSWKIVRLEIVREERR